MRGVNRQGTGKPSDSTDLHTVRHKNLKPYIDRTYLKDLDIVIGKNHRFTAKVAGEPVATVKWKVLFYLFTFKLKEKINKIYLINNSNGVFRLK